MKAKERRYREIAQKYIEAQEDMEIFHEGHVTIETSYSKDPLLFESYEEAVQFFIAELIANDILLYGTDAMVEILGKDNMAFLLMHHLDVKHAIETDVES